MHDCALPGGPPAFFLIFLFILLALTILYVLSQKGRRGMADLEDLSRYPFAHRGFHGVDIPENSAKAFRLAAQKGLGAELDVHLLADGGLAVLHDGSLLRMTGKEGEIENLTTADLPRYHLAGTAETIPTLQEVLDIYQDAGPLIVELKTCKGNAFSLCEAACRQLDAYPGRYVIESFDPKALWWLRRHRPDIIRGQLATDFIKEENTLPLPLAFGGTFMLANLFTRPDFIAYHFQDRKNLSNLLALKLWKVQGASWTIKSMEEYEITRAEGLWVIFENFDPSKEIS